MKNNCGYETCTRFQAKIIGDCKFCLKSFCLFHRLPEEHSCNKIEECKRRSYDDNKMRIEKYVNKSNIPRLIFSYFSYDEKLVAH
jgi:predicted nucleic acid binding AN1-type Zn finger protein